MKNPAFKLLMLCFFLFPAACFSNDSTARIAAGGIEFQKSDVISMESEHLEISTSQIRLSYVFLNNSPKPLTSLVVFPMPEYGWNAGESAYEANIGPIYEFKAYEDDKEITTSKVRRARIDGKDVTSDLRRIGLSETQIFENWAGAKFSVSGDLVFDISKEQIGKIRRLGKPQKAEDYVPNWKISDNITWTQTFPPGRRITITHTYKPLVGGIYSYYMTSDKGASFELPSSAVTGKIAEACVEKSIKAGIIKQIKAITNEDNIMVLLKDVEYILGTGRNWAGPIKQFTLTIKKESKEQLVSACFPGKPQKVDDLTIRFRKKNYIPQDRLVAYFYSIQR